jgi:regulator of cell morphogenesis and NO signaling
MQMTYTVQTQVGQFVADMPGRFRIFQDRGIDFCCGGKQPLAQACREKGIDANALLKELVGYQPRAEDAAGLANATLTAICDQIEATHHAFLRDTMPRLSMMAAKVANVHGPRHPEMVQVHQTFEALWEEMQSHMMKEERILFPGIRAMEAGDAEACSHCGSVQNPIHVMEHEHDNAGSALATMRRLTGDYKAPADACNTFRALLSGLADVEADMHQHVHKENNILFPKAIMLESKLRGR